jgi:subtilisin
MAQRRKVQSSERKAVIVTFKKKDARSTDADKQEIAQDAISSEVQFFSATDFARGPSPVPSDLDPETVGYDVNRYDAPILMASLTDAEIEALRSSDDVVSVEDDGPMYALQGAPVVEGTPEILAETIPTGVNQIKAPQGWGASQGLAIKVYVLDTGIDSDHPDLVANLKLGQSFVPTESSTDDFNGHGTHCAGTVAAPINGVGVVGVAPYAYVHPVKVLSSTGSGQWSWLIAGIDWVRQKKGIRIISMSLGGTAPNAVKDMCDGAYNDGILLIAAAGNSGPDDNTVGDPARYDSVVAVSAIDSADVIATFSSRGPQVEVAAPGVNVLSTIPGGGTGAKSGTSMACPHVAGAAAMAWGSHRSANNKQIRWLLQNTAFNLGAPGRDNLYGFGRVDAQSAAVWMGAVPEA